MQHNDLIPHLFRTEFSKLTAVLCKTFGLEHIEMAEDIVSDTFLLAAETWGLKGIPDKPTAWLYTVARNKTKDALKRHKLFHDKISPEIKHIAAAAAEITLDLSSQNIDDSQLQMMFALCHPSIPAEAQIGLSLRILCGFGIDEIAEAFLTNKEVINKRLYRAKERLREAGVKIELPAPADIGKRLETVLTTLYLLFNEGYYSSTQAVSLRKDLCLEAMRLCHFLSEHPPTNRPAVNALLSLMCFHASRFEARLNQQGALVLYQEQDVSLWNKELIAKGEHYLQLASRGENLSRYHLEAAIAYWHTNSTDTAEKWENILQLYNRLLQIDYSPIAALNRTYALFKAEGAAKAIGEAEKLALAELHLYHALLGHLYAGLDRLKALHHLQKALALAKTPHDKELIAGKIEKLGKI